MLLVLALGDQSGGEKFLQEEGEEEIDDEDGEGGVDHGLGGAASDADGSIFGAETLVAGDEDDENSEDGAFDHGDGDVGVVGVVDGICIPVDGGDMEGVNADDVGGEDPEGGGLGDEQRHGDEHGDDSRGDEKVDGVDGHGSEGVDLFGDFHGAEFGGHGGTDTSGEHESGDGGAEFPEHGDADEGSAEGLDVEEGELEEGLGGEDGTGEGAGDDDDGLGAVADFGDLDQDLPPALLSPEDGLAGLADEPREFPEVGEQSQHEMAEDAEGGHFGRMRVGGRRSKVESWRGRDWGERLGAGTVLPLGLKKTRLPRQPGLEKGVEHAYKEALSAAEALKPTDLDALICMGSPVFGLRPMRAARFFTSNVPKPISWTLVSARTPLAMEARTAATASSAARLVASLPSAFWTDSINSALFMAFPFCAKWNSL